MRKQPEATVAAPGTLPDAWTGEVSVDVDRVRGHSMGDLLRRSAARTPDKLAIIDGPLRQTFAKLDEAVDNVAAVLLGEGLQRGDRLALLARNCHPFVVVYFACARVGIIVVPINFLLGPGEVADLLTRSGATAIVAAEQLHPVACEALRREGLSGQVRLRGIIGLGAHGDWQDVGEWMCRSSARPPEAEPPRDDDPLELLYTSGTESRPKGAILTHRSVIAEHLSCVVGGEMTGDDVEVHAMPLYHCAQLHCFLTVDIHLGATSVIRPGADAAGILAAVEEHRATKLFAPPTVWIGLLRHPDFGRRDLSSLVKAYYGASPMPTEVLAELRHRLPHVRLFNFYGQTELGPLAAVLAPEDQDRKAGSAGRPVANVETVILDEAGNSLPPGSVGEIAHRSPQTIRGYWADPIKTAEAFAGGWFHSGDLGFFDDEGYLTVVDRKKDMIKTGGENVSSREVEEVLYRHPAVAEAAVFGVAHPRWVEAVAAAVVLRGDQKATPEELITYVRSELAAYKTPKTLEILNALPKNASGKILKRQLRADAAGSAGADLT